MSTLRFRVVEKAFQAKPLEVPAPKERPGEYFGKYVFNREKCSNTFLLRYLHVSSTPWTTVRLLTARLPMQWPKG